ncbi:MerR family DNA-binding transcriptional regulator [Micromonospora musae]|uniref:MerR family DNA-binding transcriptional regulator n=1 Tax=Micromonospora musae TaxID=1894970 RepID=UPI0033EA2116
MTNSRLRSGELADAAGVNRQTLRYYERRGLLAAPERRQAVIGSTRRRQSPCYT